MKDRENSLLAPVEFPVDVRSDITVGDGLLTLTQVTWVAAGLLLGLGALVVFGLDAHGILAALLAVLVSLFVAFGGPATTWRRFRYGTAADEVKADPLAVARAAKGLSALAEVRSLRGPFIEYERDVWGMVLTATPKPWHSAPEAERVRLLARLEQVIGDLAAMGVTVEYTLDVRPHYIRQEVERLTRMAAMHQAAGRDLLARLALQRRDHFAAMAASDRCMAPALLFRLLVKAEEAQQQSALARLRGRGARRVVTAEAAAAHLAHAARIVQTALGPYMAAAVEVLGSEAVRDEILWQFEPEARRRTMAVQPALDARRTREVQAAAQAWDEVAETPLAAVRVAVWAPVRGAGVTTAAVNLAVAIRESRPLLLDLSGSDAAALLGIRPGVQAGDEAYGVRVAGGPAHHRVGSLDLPPGEADQAVWEAFLNGLDPGDSGVVVLDLPPGGPAAVAGLLTAHVVIVVLSSTDAAATKMLTWLARHRPAVVPIALLREDVGGHAPAPPPGVERVLRVPADPLGYRAAADTGTPYATRSEQVWVALSTILGGM